MNNKYNKIVGLIEKHKHRLDDFEKQPIKFINVINALRVDSEELIKYWDDFEKKELIKQNEAVLDKIIELYAQSERSQSTYS